MNLARFSNRRNSCTVLQSRRKIRIAFVYRWLNVFLDGDADGEGDERGGGGLLRGPEPVPAVFVLLNTVH